MSRLCRFLAVCLVALTAVSCDALSHETWGVIITGYYRVGDYYNVDGKEGVVFEVSADGRHGKIVSLKRSSERLLWSSNYDEQNRFIGAADENDGSKNMAKVMQIPGWRDKYSAFAWCASLGEGWYLPAKEELLSIYRVKNKLNNNTLADKGEKIGDDWYWSSTEYDYQYSSGEFCAWGVGVGDGYTSYNSKYYYGYVRAVSAF
ncbi:MAG: DUF1566 domain-containing protein [Alistipes sp.]|nr:DUF1566 domain-containing protein [Alistipes sp.]